MGVSRRDFLKISGSTVLLGSLGVNLDPAKAYAQGLRIKDAKETQHDLPVLLRWAAASSSTPRTERSSTPRAIPIIRSMKAHSAQKAHRCTRSSTIRSGLTKPKYRAPGAAECKEVEWDWALDEIAKRVKDTRDKTFKLTSKSKVKEKQPDGTEKEVEKDFTVNRTDGIAHVGSAALDNEECYMLQKMLRSWGLVYIEHQARI